MHSFTSHDGNIRVVLFDPHEDHLDGFYWNLDSPECNFYLRAARPRENNIRQGCNH